MSRVTASGPPVQLHPEQAQTIALLLHELATNAIKHGALSAANGTLDIRWSTPREGLLEIDWSEHLEPSSPALQEPARTGFGSTLLRRVVEDQLGGSVSRSFEPAGLKCRLEIPLDHARAFSGNPKRRQPSDADGDRYVLLVEDEAILAMDLAGLVEDLGFKVFATASNVQDALASLANDTPALAILDANLSGVSSEPVARVLRERGVPVIVATGYAAGAGVDGLSELPRLIKPVTAERLAKAIADLGIALDQETKSHPS